MEKLAVEIELMQEEATFRGEIATFRLPHYEVLPDVGLYMDQLLSVLDKYFAPLAASGGQFAITGAMINNYVKLGILPRPEKKRYSAEHIAMLAMICMLKQALTMSEIALLLEGVEGTIGDRYNEFCCAQERVFSSLDIRNASDPLELALLSVTTKLYAQKIIKTRYKAD